MKKRINKVFLITGSNIGNRQENLSAALTRVSEKIGEPALMSSVYETAPWGLAAQSEFYNQVIQLATQLSPQGVLNQIIDIEKEMGRVRKEKYGARIIDIDILFYNDEVIHSKHLTIPHPRIAERNFVLIPLSEIASDFVHPVIQKSVLEILKNSPDPLIVKKITKLEDLIL